MKIGSKVYIILGIVLLGGLFFVFKSKEQTPPPATTPTGSEQIPVASSSADENSQSFELIVQNKKIVFGPETLQVKKGMQVTIRITADEDEELHLHGYDKSVELIKERPGQLQFTADLTGHFPFELEKSKTDIGAVDVTPE